ncbi:MAG: hypothetical protein JRM82_00135 [Nitrososphaerota archaeon]|nr:hypothetical protein [Nitrososphaerota archaeon]
METESRISFRRYVLKMLAALSFILLDGLAIPSGLQYLGLLSAGFAIPILLVLASVVAVQVWLLSKAR